MQSIPRDFASSNIVTCNEIASSQHLQASNFSPSSAAGAGLVSSQTSVPDPYERIRIDPILTRLKRIKTSVLTAARLHVQQKDKWRVLMITLTYRPDVDWQPRQVTGLISSLRKYLATRGVEFRYVWVQEFTKKGRPHYHLLVWLPYGMKLPMADERGWWPHGMTKTEWAKCAVGYIAKYASKADSLALPAKGARMHGSGGLTGDALLEQRHWKLPSWAREITVPADACKRFPGGGLVIPGTGEILESPWEIYFTGGNVYIQKKRPVS